jgi:hypothetical protein
LKQGFHHYTPDSIPNRRLDELGLYSVFDGQRYRYVAGALDLGYTEIGSDALIDNNLSYDVHKKWGFEETEPVVYFRKKISREN